MAASVCRNCDAVDSFSSRPLPLMMPALTVCSKLERAADGDHPIADFHLIGVAQPRGRQIVGPLQPQHGQIGLPDRS